MKEKLRHLYSTFRDDPRMKIVSKITATVLTFIIIGFLVFQISSIGWRQVIQSLPTHPLFYIILILLFLILPLFQMLIFSRIWKTKTLPLLPVMLKKRALDKDILGYSGEMYLFLWAKNNLKLTRKKVYSTIKDNVIISSLVSTIVAVLLLLLFVLFAPNALPSDWNRLAPIYWIGILIVLSALIAIMVRFRRSIFSISRGDALYLFFMHHFRLILSMVLQVIQWWVIMPDVPLVYWATLLSLQVIITRIPLIPNRDLIFLGAGLELSKGIEIPTHQLAALLITSSALNKLLNLFGFLFSIVSEKRKRVKNTSGDFPS